MPAPILTRAGARLVGAIRDQNYYVNYKPQAGLRLARLDSAVAGRSFAFEVMPFEQDDSQALPGGFHVERAGEIVSVAIALQLDRMGYQVGMQLARALAPLQERLGDRFKIDLEAFGFKATFSGDVLFFVTHARENRHETTARMAVVVALAASKGAQSQVIYQPSMKDSEVATSETLAGASDRARSAAAAVVQRFVKTLLGDPRLEQALVAYVSQGAR